MSIVEPFLPHVELDDFAQLEVQVFVHVVKVCEPLKEEKIPKYYKSHACQEYRNEGSIHLLVVRLIGSRLNVIVQVNWDDDSFKAK